MENRLLPAGRIISNRPVLEGGSLREMIIYAPEAAAAASPGQIVHIDCGGDTSLRRPISICESAEGRLRLRYDIKGKGTRAMAEMRENDPISLLGPLGRGFRLPDSGRLLLAGGGLGVFPLVSAAAASRGLEVTALLGFRSASLVNSAELFEAHGCRVRICTDDGSLGEKGFVSRLLEDELSRGPATVLMCGPAPMMRACAAVCAAAGAPAQASLEERMGCGVGACLACVCRLKLREPDGKGFRLARVCVDGPVFDAEEVVWE